MSSDWQYIQIGKRDLRLDYLRGYAIFIMATSHIGLNSIYLWFTGGGNFLVGATEIFFLISGYTLGMINHGKSLYHALDRLIPRIWQVYLFSLSIAFGFSAYSLVPDSSVARLVDLQGFQDIFATVVRFITLKLHFFYSDILILYVFFLSGAVLALWALLRGWWRYVLSFSMAIYLISFLFPEQTDLPFATLRHLGMNNPLFFCAMIFGFYSRQIGTWWDRVKFHSLVDRGVILLGVLGIALYIYYLLAHPAGWGWLEDYLLEARFTRLPPLSIFLACFYLRGFYLLLTYFWQPVFRLFGWFILPIGQKPLEGFWIHLVLIAGFRQLASFPHGPSLAAASLWATVYLLVFYLAVRGFTWFRFEWLLSTPRGQVLADWLPFLTMVITLLAFIASAIIYVVPDYVWQDKLPFLFSN